MKRILASAVLAAAIVISGASASLANRLVAHVDLSKQTMTVKKDGRVLYRWRVSTARSGYRTPTGQWSPTRMHEMWYSRKYDMSPMPYSIFFYGGYAIHGTYWHSNFGTPMSHGCVNMRTDQAKQLFYWAPKGTLVVVHQ